MLETDYFSRVCAEAFPVVCETIADLAVAYKESPADIILYLNVRLEHPSLENQQGALVEEAKVLLKLVEECLPLAQKSSAKTLLTQFLVWAILGDSFYGRK